jgi:hypothetical protein
MDRKKTHDFPCFLIDESGGIEGEDERRIDFRRLENCAVIQREGISFSTQSNQLSVVPGNTIH